LTTGTEVVTAAFAAGERHRNTEFITVRNGQLVEAQVFFGGRV
jgi:hypothetical protein